MVTIDGDNGVSFETAFPIVYVFMCSSTRDERTKDTVSAYSGCSMVLSLRVG